MQQELEREITGTESVRDVRALVDEILDGELEETEDEEAEEDDEDEELDDDFDDADEIEHELEDNDDWADDGNTKKRIDDVQRPWGRRPADVFPRTIVKFRAMARVRNSPAAGGAAA